MGECEGEDDPGIDWVTAWPRVRAELLRQLSGRVRSVALAEDLCQDVAVALVSDRAPRFDTEANLLRWARRVATNKHIDHLRRSQRVELTAAYAERADLCSDVEATAEHRHQLDNVLVAFARLPVGDAAALKTGNPAEATAAERNRLNVRRHRARQRLVTLVEGMGAVAAVILGAGRRSTRTTVATASLAAMSFVLTQEITAPDMSAADAQSDRFFGADAGWHPVPAAASKPAGTLMIDRPNDAGTANRQAIVDLTPTEGQRVGLDRHDEQSPPTICWNNVPVADSSCVDRPALPVRVDPPPLP